MERVPPRCAPLWDPPAPNGIAALPRGERLQARQRRVSMSNASRGLQRTKEKRPESQRRKLLPPIPTKMPRPDLGGPAFAAPRLAAANSAAEQRPWSRNDL